MQRLQIYSNPSSNIISTQDQILFGNEKFPIQVSKAGLSWNERERLGSKEFSPTIPLDDSPLLLLLSLLLLFAVVVVDATRTRVVFFGIVGGGCVEDRTGPVPRFSFSSSTIMTREIPVVGLFSKGRKVWRNTVWQTRALISLNNGIPLTFHFCEPLRSRRSNSSSRDLSGDVDRVVRRGRREKVKGSLSNTLT